MIKKAVLNLSQAAEKYRLVIWVLLLLLTMLILSFPVHLKYEFHPIQSPYVFGNNLPLFSALYCIWMLLLLVLIFSRKDAKWEKLALVCIFAIVFLGFWAIITPLFRHQDEWYRAAHIQYLQDYGRISLDLQYLGYFYWPGIQLLGLTISQVTGLDIFAMRTVLVLFLALLLSTLLYLLFLKSLNNPSIAATGVLLFILGNIIISKGSMLFSSYLAEMFIPLFLILQNKHEHALLETWQERVILIILLLATTITHFVSSVALFLILSGIYLVQKLDKKIPLTSAGLVILSLLIMLAWLIYVSYNLFDNLIVQIPNLLGGGFTLAGLFVGAGAAVGTQGGGVPLWALINKLFWWTFIYGFGSILWIKSLIRLKKLSPLEKKLVGGLAGIIILAIIATFAGAEGYQGAVRYLRYAPLFTVPFILRFFLNFSDSIRRFSIALLAIVLFGISLPTFFVNFDMVVVDATYPSEISAREYLRSTYREGEDLTVIATIHSLPLNEYYLPEADFKWDSGYFYSKKRDDLWVELNALVSIFSIPDERMQYGVREQAVFIYSQRFRGAYEHMLGFKPTHPEWLKLENRLSSATNRVYNNGDVQLFHLFLRRP